MVKFLRLFYKKLKSSNNQVVFDEDFYAECLRFKLENQDLLSRSQGRFIELVSQVEPPLTGWRLVLAETDRTLVEIQEDLFCIAIPAGATISLLLVLQTTAPLLLQMLHESA